MKGIIRRLEIIENEVNLSSGIPENERLIVIPFYTEDELERAETEAIESLKQKYGSAVSIDDLLIVAIRKFAPRETA